VRLRGPRRARVTAGPPSFALLLLLASLASPAVAGPPAGDVNTRARTSAAIPSPARRTAPDIEADRWLHGRLRPKDVAGKPRLVEFWTAGCVNCERTAPAIREIQYLYGAKGLVLIGVHTPEFPRLRDSTLVAATAREWGLTFPIALDDDSVAWKAFRTRYWPTLYLIDRKGTIRATHVGELHVKTRAWSNFTESIEDVLAERD
jgi:thiol-disulfide isomerase/thioredoxin